MSQAELKTDQRATYEALLRLIEAGRTDTQAFRKLTERLAWVNAEMVRRDLVDPEVSAELLAAFKAQA